MHEEVVLGTHGHEPAGGHLDRGLHGPRPAFVADKGGLAGLAVVDHLDHDAAGEDRTGRRDAPLSLLLVLRVHAFRHFSNRSSAAKKPILSLALRKEIWSPWAPQAKQW